MNAAIIVKPKGDNKPIIEQVIHILKKYNITPMLDKDAVVRFVLDSHIYTIDELKQKADFAIILGGDGTILYASRIFGNTNIPLLAFNLGRIGFIMEHEIRDFESTIQDYIAGKVVFQNRMKITGSIISNDQIILQEDALNEIVISKGAPSRMIELSITIDGNFVTQYRSDGAIISTPTGSTGYTISAGGPIVHPEIDTIILSPICPHALNIRPIVLPKNSVISISVQNDNTDCFVTIDGQIVKEFKNKDILKIKKSNSELMLASNPHRNYYDILRSKLGWGEVPC